MTKYCQKQFPMPTRGASLTLTPSISKGHATVGEVQDAALAQPEARHAQGDRRKDDCDEGQGKELLF